MANRQRLVLKVVISCLFLLALLLFSYPFFRNTWMMYHYEHTSIKQVTTLPDKIAPAEPISPPKLTDVMTFQETKANAIGQIVIPDVGISENIFVGMIPDNMNIGVVSMFPDRLPGKATPVIIGHHLGIDKLIFGNLAALDTGEKVYLNYLGQTYLYTVTQKGLIDAKATNRVSDQGEDKLLLLTCASSVPSDDRILIECTLERTQTNRSHLAIDMKKEAQTIEKDRLRALYYQNFLPLVLGLALFMVCNGLMWRFL